MKSVLESAGRSVEQQRKDHFRRKAVVRNVHKVFECKQDGKDRKEMKERVKAEDWGSEIGKYGGLWLTEVQVDRRSSTMGCQDERKIAVESQLKFRKFVLSRRMCMGV